MKSKLITRRFAKRARSLLAVLIVFVMSLTSFPFMTGMDIPDDSGSDVDLREVIGSGGDESSSSDESQNPVAEEEPVQDSPSVIDGIENGIGGIDDIGDTDELDIDAALAADKINEAAKIDDAIINIELIDDVAITDEDTVNDNPDIADIEIEIDEIGFVEAKLVDDTTEVLDLFLAPLSDSPFRTQLPAVTLHSGNEHYGWEGAAVTGNPKFLVFELSGGGTDNNGFGGIQFYLQDRADWANFYTYLGFDWFSWNDNFGISGSEVGRSYFVVDTTKLDGMTELLAAGGGNILFDLSHSYINVSNINRAWLTNFELQTGTFATAGSMAWVSLDFTWDDYCEDHGKPYTVCGCERPAPSESGVCLPITRFSGFNADINGNVVTPTSEWQNTGVRMPFDLPDGASLGDYRGFRIDVTPLTGDSTYKATRLYITEDPLSDWPTAQYVTGAAGNNAVLEYNETATIVYPLSGTRYYSNNTGITMDDVRAFTGTVNFTFSLHHAATGNNPGQDGAATSYRIENIALIHSTCLTGCSVCNVSCVHEWQTNHRCSICNSLHPDGEAHRIENGICTICGFIEAGHPCENGHNIVYVDENTHRCLGCDLQGSHNYVNFVCSGTDSCGHRLPCADGHLYAAAGNDNGRWGHNCARNCGFLDWEDHSFSGGVCSKCGYDGLKGCFQGNHKYQSQNEWGHNCAMNCGMLDWENHTFGSNMVCTKCGYSHACANGHLYTAVNEIGHNCGRDCGGLDWEDHIFGSNMVCTKCGYRHACADGHLITFYNENGHNCARNCGGLDFEEHTFVDDICTSCGYNRMTGDAPEEGLLGDDLSNLDPGELRDPGILADDDFIKNILYNAIEAGRTPVLVLSDIIAETGGSVISAELLLYIKELGVDVIVELPGGFSYTIIAGSIGNSVGAFDLLVDIYITTDDVTIDGQTFIGGSIVIDPNFTGFFGFDIKIHITSAQLREAGIEADNINLFHIDHSNKVTFIGELRANSDGSVDFTINHASYYKISGVAFTLTEDSQSNTALIISIIFFALTIIAGTVVVIIVLRKSKART